MMHDAGCWDEMEETGLRVCLEDSSINVRGGLEVTACCWDPCNPGMIGLCARNGTFIVMSTTNALDAEPDGSRRYAVYFNTLPVHLWGSGARGGGIEEGNGRRSSGAVRTTQSPARRLGHAWSQVAFVPGHDGEVVFAQGWSPRILVTTLPKLGEGCARTMAPTVLSNIGRRFGFLDGSRVVALAGHKSQLQCLAIDKIGRLLVTGDESGAVCARILHRNASIRNRPGADGRSGEGVFYGDGDDRDALAVIVSGAHEGGVLAVSHVERKGDNDGELESTFFVSGGSGGIVRVWRATCGSAGEMAGSREKRLRVELLTNMHVGGCQVSSLTTCPSYRTPLVLAGTIEGTVFGFALEPRSRASALSNSRGGGDAPLDGKVELGQLVMKFEHTSLGIKSVTCSRDQELIATADADGIVRTYRPLPLRDTAAADGQVLFADASADLQFQLIVECRLGSSPVVCEFAMEKNTDGEDQADLDEWREVLRTCTRDNGRLRVWPAADLPTRPLRPLPLEPPSSPPFSHPPPETPIPTCRQDQRLSEPMDRSGRQRGREEHERREDGSVGFVEEEATGDQSGTVGGEEDAMEWQGDDVEARGGVPVPGAQPTASRRVSFAPAEQVYKSENCEDSQTISSWPEERAEVVETDEEEHEQVPRPPPPAPTPTPSGPAHPRQLRYSRGSPWRGGRRPMDVAGRTEVGAGDGGFLPPSTLQEASLWSTAVEQAELEHRMKEDVELGAIRESIEKPAFRAAAASAVNVHPKARTFTGLVPVSLDAPPPRPKRMGKQVSTAYLSKVEERRITEQDLLFDDMEPAVSSVASDFGSARMPDRSRGLRWPHAELEWYGRRPAFQQQEDSSFVPDRVWSWGLRP